MRFDPSADGGRTRAKGRTRAHIRGELALTFVNAYAGRTRTESGVACVSVVARRNARLAKPYREIQPRRASFMIRFLTEGVR